MWWEIVVSQAECRLSQPKLIDRHTTGCRRYALAGERCWRRHAHCGSEQTMCEHKSNLGYPVPGCSCGLFCRQRWMSVAIPCPRVSSSRADHRTKYRLITLMEKIIDIVGPRLTASIDGSKRRLLQSRCSKSSSSTRSSENVRRWIGPR